MIAYRPMKSKGKIKFMKSTLLTLLFQFLSENMSKTYCILAKLLSYFMIFVAKNEQNRNIPKYVYIQIGIYIL